MLNLPRDSIFLGVLSFFSFSSFSYSSFEDFSSSLSDGQLMWSWIISCEKQGFQTKLYFSLLRVVNSEETGLLQVRLSAEYGRWLVWRVKGLKGKQYRFWRPIIGKRTRGLLTHCQTSYQLQFGIRLQQNHIDIISMADSAHLYVFFLIDFQLDARYSVPYNYINVILTLQIMFI